MAVEPGERDTSGTPVRLEDIFHRRSSRETLKVTELMAAGAILAACSLVPQYILHLESNDFILRSRAGE